MTHCIFCQINQRKQDASIVYENEDFMVIMDAYPLTDAHTLVIPKQHVQRLHELSSAQQQQLFALGQQVLEAQKHCGWGKQGANLVLNDGKAANQTVPHLHLHLIPRKPRDLLSTLPKLALHVTGLFGFGINRTKLDQQAQALSAHFSKNGAKHLQASLNHKTDN